MHEPSNNLAIPPQIDSIEILELLGTGGMSHVFKAKQKLQDRIVAIIVLSGIARDKGIKRFQKEGIESAQVARELD